MPSPGPGAGPPPPRAPPRRSGSAAWTRAGSAPRARPGRARSARPASGETSRRAAATATGRVSAGTHTPARRTARVKGAISVLSWDDFLQMVRDDDLGGHRGRVNSQNAAFAPFRVAGGIVA